mgnify:CR=1 FL=1
MTVLAIDIGGTKIAAALVDGNTLVHRTQVPTPQTSAEDAWHATADLITTTLAAGAGGAVEAVGISSAGPVDLGAGAISPVNIGVWRDFPIVASVAELTGLPVRLGGDGLCMALGEHRYGAGRDAQFVLGMVVSTGIGGGLVLDGMPYDGRTGNAGHVGHTVIELDGQRCPCGGRGCVETVASGPSMTRWARAQGWAGTDARELAADVQRDDPIAVEAFRRGATAVAAMPPMATIANKEMVNSAFEMTLDQGLIVERRIFQILTASEDKAEGMAAFIEKREGQWKGR